MSDRHYTRLPITANKSLKAFSAADDYLLTRLSKLDIEQDASITLYHDRFGYLWDQLSEYEATSYVHLQSQQVSSLANSPQSSVDKIKTIFDTSEKGINVSLLRIPKSLELYRIYIRKISQSLSVSGVALAGFMTKHYSPSMISIAEEYFGQVTQSRAYKKSRIIEMSMPIRQEHVDIKINELTYNGDTLKQYEGVFSSGHIDYATQFLLLHLQKETDEKSFLDIGCGNGIITHHLLSQDSWVIAVAMDDSVLAERSAALNLSDSEHCSTLWDYRLDRFEDSAFDLVVTNPPFHFEYEIDTSIAIQMFRDAYRVLSDGGRLVVVANNHLRYKGELARLYREVTVLAQNKKFVVYQGRK